MMMKELRPVTYKEGWVLRLFHLKKSEEGYIIAAFGYLKGRCRKDWGRLLLGFTAENCEVRESMQMVKRVMLIDTGEGEICSEDHWILE